MPATDECIRLQGVHANACFAETQGVINVFIKTHAFVEPVDSIERAAAKQCGGQAVQETAVAVQFLPCWNRLDAVEQYPPAAVDGIKFRMVEQHRRKNSVSFRRPKIIMIEERDEFARGRRKTYISRRRYATTRALKRAHARVL